MTPTISAILKPEVQRIFDHLGVCFNTRIVFFNAAGELVAACRNRSDSPYCQLLRARLLGADTCHALDRAQCFAAARAQRILRYECHAGLIEATKPVRYCGRILGFVTIGQLRVRPSMPEAIRDAWAARRFAPAELAAAYAALPLLTPEHIDAMLDLFSMVIDYVVSQQMIVLATQRNLAVALNYLEQHAAENPTLQDVARLIGKKPSTVSHLFTRHLGQSFKRTLQEIRLRHAEEYLRHHPEPRIAEAALAAGFTDPLYFSRLYTRYRGVPPSHFLAACRRADDEA